MLRTDRGIGYKNKIFRRITQAIKICKRYKMTVTATEDRWKIFQRYKTIVTATGANIIC